MSGKEKGKGKGKGKETTALPWLDALEEKTQDAVERLSGLTAENRRLVARIEELEAVEDGGDGEAADWRRERDEIRQRVQRLTETLDRLSQGETAD